MSEPAIKVQNLTKIYGAGETTVHALRSVDLEVAAGELLLLLGASGSGKTTLISIIGGILSATSGSCLIRGTETVGLPQSKLPKVRRDNIGFIFQAVCIIIKFCFSSASRRLGVSKFSAKICPSSISTIRSA